MTALHAYASAHDPYSPEINLLEQFVVPVEGPYAEKTDSKNDESGSGSAADSEGTSSEGEDGGSKSEESNEENSNEGQAQERAEEERGSERVSATNPQSSAVGGRASLDLIVLRASQFNFPLRYGNVIPQSETVDLAGRMLRRGTDYAIDYESGSITLLVPFDSGQSLRVQYRYDHNARQTGVFTPGGEAAAFSGLTFQFAPGSSAYLGMGLTERLADGTVITSNVYGINNSFSFSGGNLSGVFLVGERQRAQTMDLLSEEDAQGVPGGEGTGHAIIQQFMSEMLGGQVTAYYQDIEEKFAGFQALGANGFDQAQIDLLSRQRGLKKSAFQISDVGFDGLRVSNGFTTVGSDAGSVNWRNAGVNFLGVQVDWEQLSIDSGFERFQDLGVRDWREMAKERGTTRESLSIGTSLGGADLQFLTNSLRTEDGVGFDRYQYGIKSPWLELSYQGRSVDSDFNRFGDIRDEDRQQLSRERGFSRSALQLSTGVLGGPLAFSRSSFGNEDASFRAQDFNYDAGRLSIRYAQRGFDDGFRNFQGLEAERQGHVDSIVWMVDPGARTHGNDVSAFSNSAGLDRTATNLSYDFGAGTSLFLHQYRVSNEDGAIGLDRYLFSSPNIQFSYIDQQGDPEFGSSRDLMHTERSVLGDNTGLSKTDIAFQAMLGGSREFAYSSMSATDPDGQIGRTSLSYADKGFNLSYNQRNIENDFGALRFLVDHERDLFWQMRGYNQTELALDWNLFKHFDVRMYVSDANNPDLDLDQVVRHMRLGYEDDRTKVLYDTFEHRINDPDFAHIDRQSQLMSFSRDLGRFGRISLEQERQQFLGEDDDLPDALRRTISYDAKISSSTAIATEQSLTTFENGETETVSSNTISHDLSDRMGVSITQTNIRRDGEGNDEEKRQYGFWYDFGQGIRLQYGYNRHRDGEDDGTLNERLRLTGGQFAGLKLETGNGDIYRRDSWDNRRDRHVGNIALGTIEPMQWGFLRDVEFGYAVDTLRDNYLWQKEDRTMHFAARIGSVAFGIGYVSRIDRNQDRLIDRKFAFTTDSSGEALIRADIGYTLRTLPNDEDVMIRDYKLVAQPNEMLSLTHEMSTNPLRDDRSLLGSIPTEIRSNKWAINYGRESDLFAGAFVYEQLINDRTGELRRETGLDISLFGNSGNPMTIEYRMGQRERDEVRRTSHEIWIRWDQRPGPNQHFSVAVGNRSYEHIVPVGINPNRWHMRLDYSLRF